MAHLRTLLFVPLLLLAAGPAEEARKEILAAYRSSLDALARGDADGAPQIDTEDWTSVTVGQKPRTRQEMEPYIRRDIASMRPPPDWAVFWKPDYEKNGTGTGIQIYDLSLDRSGNNAVILCLVGGTRMFAIRGLRRRRGGSGGCMKSLRSMSGWLMDGRLHVLNQSHKAKIHVQLLVAVEEG